MPMPAIRSCRAKHNNQEKYYSFIEGRSDKNFRVVKLFSGSIFAIILFYTVMYSVHRHGHHCRSSPPGWGANSSQNFHSCSFCSHKQRCWTVLSELRYEVASILNTFFLRWEHTSYIILIHQNVCSKPKLPRDILKMSRNKSFYFGARFEATCSASKTKNYVLKNSMISFCFKN